MKEVDELVEWAAVLLCGDLTPCDFICNGCEYESMKELKKSLAKQILSHPSLALIREDKFGFDDVHGTCMAELNALNILIGDGWRKVIPLSEALKEV